MLLGKPKRFFSADYSLFDGDREVALLDVSSWRERATLEIDGAAYTFAGQGVFGRTFLLQRDDHTLATAEKPSAFRNRFEVEHQGRRYQVEKAGFWRRDFAVLDNGRQIGSVRASGVFSRDVTVDLPADWPLPLQVFVFWLVLVLWKRQAAVAVSAGAGS